jgi:hypothetical protein
VSPLTLTSRIAAREYYSRREGTQWLRQNPAAAKALGP